MKKITLLLVMLLSSITGFSQFSEGFETEIPASFTVNNGGSANGWVHSTAPSGGAHTGSGVARIVYNADAHDDDLITPQMTIASGVNDRLSFWIKSRSASYLEPYQVLLSTTDTATGSFTVTLQAEQEAPNSWENIEVDLTGYVGQSVYVAIKATGTNEWELYVDDVVNDAAPACPNPTGLTVDNFTGPSSADVSWTAAAGATNYNWEIQPQGVAQGTAGAIDSGALAGISTTATNLVDGTNYTLYVQSDCGGALGNWVSLDFTYILPPANDECDNAIGLTVNSDLACGTVTAGTTVGATASSQTDDVTGTPNTDVWFSFVATGTEHTVSLTNVINQGGGTSTSTDMGMGVYDATGGCASLVFVDDSDPNILNLSGLTAATTYYVRVYGWSTTVQYNNFDICVGTPPAPPENDDCDGAIAITPSADDTCANAVSGSTQSAAASSSPACTGGKDVWYSFVAAEDGEYIASVTETFESGFASTYFSAYEGACDALVQVGSSTSCFNTGDLTIATVAGQTYFISVRSSSTTNYVEFDLCVYPKPAPIAGQLCETAIDASTLPFSTTDDTANYFDDYSGSPGASCSSTSGYLNGDDVVYSYTATEDAVIAVDLTNIGSTYAGVFVYADCADIGTTCLDGATNLSSTADLSFDFDAVSGETYYIVISTWASPQATTYTLDITNASLSVDEFENNTLFSYYPNPVKNTLTLNAQKEISSVNVVNMLGQTVLKTTPNAVSNELDMSSLKSGAYFVQVTVGNAVETVKIIKN